MDRHVEIRSDISDEKLGRWLPIGHGLFWGVTGIWPMFDMQSFERVTGTKHDTWLVQTFGLLLFAFGAALTYIGLRERICRAVSIVAFAGATMLMFADVLFVFRGAIGTVYLIDAAIEALLALFWGDLLRRYPLTPK